MALGAAERTRPATDLAPPLHAGPRRQVIEPSSGWVPLQLGVLWSYRELLFFMAWRDIKVRYKQTVLGAAWAVLQPVITMVVMSLIFGHFAKIPSDGVPYPLFVFSGLLPWTFFTYAMTQASGSLINNANLISKVYFPRLIMPLAATVAGLMDFAIAFVVLILLMLYYHVMPTASVLLVPVFVVIALISALAVGIWFAALSVQYRDIRYTVPFLTQIWLYLTPIVYPSSATSGAFRVILALNPMAGAVEGFRWALLGGRGADGFSMITSNIVTVVILIAGLFYFRRMEQRFADIV